VTVQRTFNLNIGAHWTLTGVHGGGTRAVVMGTRGAVSTAHWQASQEGLRILQSGGNAFDAAVAAAAVVTVVEPFMSGIGGSGAAVCYHADSGRCEALDFHGFAPKAAAPERWRHQEDLIDGADAALVPAVVAGWDALLGRYGTMTLADVLPGAIECAAKGIPISMLCSHHIQASAARLRRSDAAARIFLPGGRPLDPGELLVQRELGETLQTLADEGARSFYEGSVAAAIADGCARAGGIITRDDLAACGADWLDCAVCSYRGWNVHTLPPPYGSVQTLQTLRILEGIDLAALGHHTSEHLHMLIESIKLARTDRLAFASGDPSVDYTRLLDETHVAELRSHIDPDRAAETIGERYRSTVPPVRVEHDLQPKHTTHLVTADGAGNLVSLTQTLGWLFGSATMVGDTGVFLNDMCYWFDLEPASPNVIGPRKKMVSPVAPVIALDGTDSLKMAVGTPGGHGILQTTAQMVSNVLDFDMNPQSAVEAPRIRVDEGQYVAVEGRVPASVIEELRARGHRCDVVGDWIYESSDGRADIGRASLVIFDGSTTVAYAGADPRGDGLALAP
jgi:gamma-glutamyltranspeptidase/glutathione hydrolase